MLSANVSGTVQTPRLLPEGGTVSGQAGPIRRDLHQQPTITNYSCRISPTKDLPILDPGSDIGGAGWLRRRFLPNRRLLRSRCVQWPTNSASITRRCRR